MEKQSIVILLVFMFVVAGCSREQSSNIIEQGAESEKAIKNFTLIETEGPIKKWVMEASSAVFEATDNDEKVRVRDIDMKFFEQEAVQTCLKAESGIYSKKTQTLVTNGRVEINTETKKIITTNVIWDPVRKLFITSEEVIVKTPEGEIEGRGMEASMDLSSISIKEKISGELRE